ncbi:MAG: hypothetical protein A2Y66_01780 [Nitrospirae bacterium RBG_13_41_22]|nr:MAG: hypothetical protein A2Y66_01780 [Nitrospirae bacterium RBG_13_41_22]
MNQAQINLQDIAREQVLSQIISERDQMIMALVQSNGELQQKIKELETEIKKSKDGTLANTENN